MWGFLKQTRESAPPVEGPKWVPYHSPLVRELSRYLERHPNAFILDLGRVRSLNVEYYARFSAKVFVEDITDDAIASVVRNNVPPTQDAESLPQEVPEKTPVLESFLGSKADYRFEAILCWDMFNYLPDARAKELAAALTEKSADGAMIYLHTWNSKTIPSVPMAYDLLPDDNITYDPTAEERIPSSGLGMTGISKLFPHFERVQSFLSRTGIEEHTLIKRVPSVIMER